jgi:hypothetical protein
MSAAAPVEAKSRSTEFQGMGEWQQENETRRDDIPVDDSSGGAARAPTSSSCPKRISAGAPVETNSRSTEFQGMGEWQQENETRREDSIPRVESSAGAGASGGFLGQ